ALALPQRLLIGDREVLARPDIRFLEVRLRLEPLQTELLLGFEASRLLHEPALNSGELSGEAPLGPGDADEPACASLQVVSFKSCRSLRHCALVSPLGLLLLGLPCDRGGKR